MVCVVAVSVDKLEVNHHHHNNNNSLCPLSFFLSPIDANRFLAGLPNSCHVVERESATFNVQVKDPNAPVEFYIAGKKVEVGGDGGAGGDGSGDGAGGAGGDGYNFITFFMIDLLDLYLILL